MRRAAFVLAAAAAAVGGFASSASAGPEYTLCVGNKCVCLYDEGVRCYTPPADDPCIAVDLDRDGDAERICLVPISS